MTVRIVTDSACDVPDSLAAELGIVVVPVYVNIGDESYLDGVELSRQEFFQKVAETGESPTTAAPSTGAFTAVYQELVDQGATEIISIHIAANLSATYNSARLGAQDVTGANIAIFDTQQLAMGAGLLSIIAAEAARDGKSQSEILAMLNDKVGRVCIYAALDTLEFLRRSGRVSWAQFGLGTLLQIKPILMVKAGDVSMVARVRTKKRAVSEMFDLVEAAAPFERIAVLHTNNPAGAKEVYERARPLFPPGTEPTVMEITPAIGAHAGPGAVGLAFITVNQ